MTQRDTLLNYIKKLRSKITTEKEALVYNVSHGKIDVETQPFEYWIGQVLAYEASLNMIDEALREMYKEINDDE